jgi:hypothetical protein
LNNAGVFVNLLFPSVVDNCASNEAQENLNRLLRVDVCGCKDQVATRVALECLQRIQELHPGYLEGVKSWVKAGCVYVLGGITSVGAIGLSGWLLYEAEQYGQWSVTTLGIIFGVGSLISSELGFKPVSGLVIFLALAVRDAANRAAKWSVKHDEKTQQEKENETKECHKMIINQSLTIYNDCAKKMVEMLTRAEKDENINKLVELQQMASKLDEQFPLINKFLRGFKLRNYEIESIMQELIGAVRFVQVRACQLKLHDGYDGMNLAFIVGCPKNSIKIVTIPIYIKERIAAANRSLFSLQMRLGGYVGSIWSGGKSFVGVAGGVAAVAVVYSAYQYGVSVSCRQFVSFLSNRNWHVFSDAWQNSFVKCALLGIVGATTAVAAKKSWYHYCDVISNSNYVKTEVNSCKEELIKIYDGMTRYFKSLDETTKMKMSNTLYERMPDIKKAIQGQGFEPTEIVGNLERAIEKMPTK